jgi:hypothetical protein
MRKTFFKFIIVLFSVLFFQSCGHDFEKKELETFHYFFAGHCYQWNSPNWGRTDYRLEKIGLDTFDQIWLGGDLVENLFHHPHNIEFVDSFFQVGKSTTHWAIGNHDVLDQKGNFSGIEKRTNRKTYSTSYQNGITILVLNTTEFSFPAYQNQPHECELLDGQMNLIKAVTDTIQNSSHLIILHHHALLTNEIADQKIKVEEVFNIYTPDFNIACEDRGTFSVLVYPRLQEVQKRGVQVILIGGDTGLRVKEFDFKTKDGISFLGTGLNNSAGTDHRPDYFNPAPDKVLIFKHQPEIRKLEWEFRLLDEMVRK